jgi:hypothetical protein
MHTVKKIITKKNSSAIMINFSAIITPPRQHEKSNISKMTPLKRNNAQVPAAARL